MYIYKDRDDFHKKYFWTIGHTDPYNPYNPGQARMTSYILGHPLKTRKINPESPLYKSSYWIQYSKSMKMHSYAETPAIFIRLA